MRRAIAEWFLHLLLDITCSSPSHRHGGVIRCRFETRFPDRVFDVGIAEQHAVTFAAGLACEGLVPFATIYSTFLQRGYDQIMHDVCLQKLPGRWCRHACTLHGVSLGGATGHLEKEIQLGMA